MVSSPSSRRSPRLENHGDDAAGRNGWSPRAIGVASSLEKTTPAKAKGNRTSNLVKTPVSAGAIPFVSAMKTPDKPSKTDVSRTRKSPRSEVAAARVPIIKRQTRRAVAISPRTRGNAIASILASPGEFATNNITGTKNRFLSPSKRSSAEATLHHLARRSTRPGTKRSLDVANGAGNDPLSAQRKRRRRKAASAAHEKVRDICSMDDFDDLGEADKIPYNKPTNQGKKKKAAVSDLVVGEATQSVFASAKKSDDNKPATGVTVDTFVPKGKIEERWFRNLKKWTSAQKDGLVSESSSPALAPSSPLPKKWIQEQRAQFRLLQQNKKSQMSKDRMTLLEGAGFLWQVRNRKGCAMEDGSEKVQSNDVGKKTASSSTNASVTVGDEGEQKMNSQMKSKSNKSGKETDKSIIDSSSKRKSPRKSFPTQFYHNLGSSSSVNVKGSEVTSKIAPEQSKEGKLVGKKQSTTMAGQNASAPASPTTSSKTGKQLSPSKRLSPSNPNDSLASLPASVKNKSEKQKKKKKRRGRRSTSLLSALEVQVETSSKDFKSESSKKGSSSFSHKELKQELSKSKKKPARKKSVGVAKKSTAKKAKTSNDGGNTNKDVDEKASSTAKKSTSTDSKPSEHEPSDGKVDIKDAKKESPAAYESDASPPSPESPLRVTRLLPSLSDNSASKTNYAESSATEDSAAKMPEPEVCVTKLLLSCLSEDSTENEQAHTGSNPGEGKGASLLNNESPETKTIPGSCYFSSNVKASKEPLGDPSGDGVDTNDARGKSALSKPDEQGTDVLTTLTNNESPENTPTICATKLNLPKEPLTLHSAADEGSSEKEEAEATRLKEGVSLARPLQKNMELDGNKNHSFDNVVASEKAVGPDLTRQQVDPEARSSQPTHWTCDVCQDATFECYDDAIAHEKKCGVANKNHAEPSLSNKEEAEEEEGSEASDQRKKPPPVEESEKPMSKSIHPGSERSSATKRNLVEQPMLSQKGIASTTRDALPRKVDTWTCDVCKKAMFEDYDDAMAHERICASTNNTRATLPLSDEVEENEVEVSKQREKELPTIGAEKLINVKSRNKKPPSSSAMSGNFAQQLPVHQQHMRPKENSSDASRVLGSTKENENTIVRPARAVNANTQTASSTSNKQSANSLPTPSTHLENEVTVEIVRKQDKQQPTPVQNKDQLDESSLSLFSPLSLTSPLRANNLMESTYHQEHRGIQGGSTEQIGNYSFAPSQLNGTPSGSLVQATKPAPHSRKEMATGLANRSTLSLVSNSVASHNENPNLAFSAGERVESLQMVLAEKEYREKMAQFGRLELEAKMVTKRMREIEDRIKGRDSNTVTNGFNVDGCESISRKRSYHSESKSLAMQKSQSWSRHYESSEEEYSDEYHSPRKRRKKHSSNDSKSRMFSGEQISSRSDAYERSEKRVKVRSRSRKSLPSYDDSEIEMESSSRSKKVDRHRTERFSSPERYDNRVDNSYHSSGKKKRSKGDKTPAFANERESRKFRSRRKQKSPQPSDETMPRKPTAREADEYAEKEESYLHSGKLSVQSQDKLIECNSKSVSGKKSVQPNIDVTRTGAGEKDSDTASKRQPLGVQGSETNEEKNIISTTNSNDNDGSAQQQVNQKRDPLYWLAGGENSSDDESWDFEGPMILPPPPL